MMMRTRARRGGLPPPPATTPWNDPSSSSFPTSGRRGTILSGPTSDEDQGAAVVDDLAREPQHHSILRGSPSSSSSSPPDSSSSPPPRVGGSSSFFFFSMGRKKGAFRRQRLPSPARCSGLPWVVGAWGIFLLSTSLTLHLYYMHIASSSVSSSASSPRAVPLSTDPRLTPHHVPPLVTNTSRLSIRVINTSLSSSSSSSNSTSSRPRPSTLALLYPPGLLGGYRNQVLRLISLVVHAQEHGLTKLWLPSLLWSTQVGGISTQAPWYPIPMDWVFDVQHWNQHAPQVPRLVTHLDHSDCWTRAPNLTLLGPGINLSAESLSNLSSFSWHPLQLASLQRGYLQPLAHVVPAVMTRQMPFNPRQTDFLSQVQHCQHPVVYGGGTKSGRLWNDYLRMQQQQQQQQAKNRPGNWLRRNQPYNDSTPVILDSGLPYQADQWVYRALRPAEKWRQVAEACLQTHLPPAGPRRYAVLHARVELEIMSHVCGRDMERNLTALLQRLQAWIGPPQQPNHSVDGLMIAVSRAGMEERNTSRYQYYQSYADENLSTLNRLVGRSKATRPTSGLGSSSLPVFECGEKVLEEYYRAHPQVPDHGSLLQSAVNFHLAVQADYFVGVEGSSYSTDVWTTRYYQGRGPSNYKYTLAGIEPVPHQGLPTPHSNCGKKKTTRSRVKVNPRQQQKEGAPGAGDRSVGG